MPVVFRLGSTRVHSPVLRFAGGGTLTESAGEAVYTPPGGGGGTSDHALLSHLSWSASGHTGTASRLAYFDAGGAAAYLSLGAGLTTSGSALVVDTGTIATVASLAGYQPLNSALTSISAGTWAGSTSLTTLGTVTTGAWQGSTLGIGYGGTGATTPSGARTALGLAIGTNVQAWDADLDALAALGNGIPYRSGGVWSANALGDLAISGASIQVSQARGLRESGGTTLTMGAVAAGELLIRSGTSVVGAALGVVVQAYNALLLAIAGLASNGIIVRTSASTAAARTIQATDPQVTLLNGDGVGGNPDFYSILPGFLSGEYYAQWMTTEGATATGTLPVSTTGVTYNLFGTNNFPSMNLTSTTTTACGYRSNSACFCLAQGYTHRFQFVTGSNKTNVRWRIGLAGAAVGNALKPTTYVAYLVFDSDSGQANATTNWYLLTYDNGGGAVSYTDTGVACNTSTAYESEITTDSTHVYVRVRTVGGAWSGTTVSTTSLPAASQGMCASFFIISTTAATTRTLEIRSYHVWGRRT